MSLSYHRLCLETGRNISFSVKSSISGRALISWTFLFSLCQLANHVRLWSWVPTIACDVVSTYIRDERQKPSCPNVPAVWAWVLAKPFYKKKLPCQAIFTFVICSFVGHWDYSLVLTTNNKLKKNPKQTKTKTTNRTPKPNQTKSSKKDFS